MNVRTAAANALNEVRNEKRSLNSVLPRALDSVRETDRPLLQELLFGCCRWFFFLDDLVNDELERPLPRNEETTRILLVIGAYQLIFTRIPDHAAINETVEAARELQQVKTIRLINAILRNISRNEPMEVDERAIALSFPDWFSAKLNNNWPEQAEQVLRASNEHPPMFLRVNTSKTSRDDYIKALQSAEIECSPCDFSSKGVRLHTACDVQKLPFFEDGHVSVQDEAAQLSTPLLDLAPEMRVLDACSAPGGKTCAMLEAEPTLKVVALDQDANRLKRVTENLDRLGLTAETRAAQAENLERWYEGEPFDRVLLDAPCSATGVIRRHPDIKLLREPADLKNLAELQLELLASLWKTLKVGGKLVYATCSIFPQENARIVERFLASQQDAQLVPIESDWGVDTGFGKQLFPDTNAHDGFFYAVLSKQN